MQSPEFLIPNFDALLLAQASETAWYLLNEREQHLVRQLDLDYQSRFSRDPTTDPDLFYFMGDRYEFARTWSAVSRKIPTYRKNGALILQQSTMRFMTGMDKLASLGWPVTDTMALHMGTSTIPAVDSKRAITLAGNAMHLSNASTILLLALVCFGPK